MPNIEIVGKECFRKRELGRRSMDSRIWSQSQDDEGVGRGRQGPGKPCRTSGTTFIVNALGNH
jgi:hypothetical protein